MVIDPPEFGGREFGSVLVGRTRNACRSAPHNIHTERRGSQEGDEIVCRDLIQRGSHASNLGFRRRSGNGSGENDREIRTRKSEGWKLVNPSLDWECSGRLHDTVYVRGETWSVQVGFSVSLLCSVFYEVSSL